MKRWESCDLYVLDHETQHVRHVSELWVEGSRVRAVLGRPPDYETEGLVSWADVSREELDALGRSDPEEVPGDDEVAAVVGASRSLCLTFRERVADGE